MRTIVPSTVAMFVCATVLVVSTAACSNDESCEYTVEKQIELNHSQAAECAYARCHDGDPIVSGDCSGGADIVISRPEQLNNGTGHWYCAFIGPGVGKAWAVCSCKP